MNKAAEIEGQEISEEEKVEIEKSIESLDIEMTIWIAQAEGYVTKLAGTFKGSVEDGSGSEVDNGF